MADNFSIAVEGAARGFQAAEINSELTTTIKQQVDNIKTIIERFNNSKTKYKVYNDAYQRVQKYTEFIKNSSKLDIAEDKVESMADKVVQFDNYRISKMKQDESIIQELYNDIDSIATEGYVSIMKLRELMTGQTIIYAIEHLEKGQISHQAFLNEDEYLELFRVQRSRDLKKTSNIKRPSHFAITLDTASVINNPGIDINNSRDWAYQMLADFTQRESDKGHVIKNNERWEMYTEVKSFFGNRPSVEDFDKYMFDFLQAKNTWLRRLTTGGNIVSSQKNVMFQMSTLAFYQGGDSTYSDTILIQDKSTGAAIRVGTIYNGLKTVESVFKDFPNLDAEKVKTLFTASLQDIPNQIVNIAFQNANIYAQRRIDEVVKSLKVH